MLLVQCICIIFTASRIACSADCSNSQRSFVCLSVHLSPPPVWGLSTPLFPIVCLLPHFFPFYFSLSFIGFTYFLLLSIPSPSTRIVPLHFQAGGRRKRPNLGLVCCVFCISELRWILVFCSMVFG